MRVGVSGHQRLKNSTMWQEVRLEINVLLEAFGVPLCGITSLAVGADQVFAEAVLQRGGSIEVVIPFAEYERVFISEHDRKEYRRLLGKAARSVTLDSSGSDQEDFLQAGKRVVDEADCLCAIWDGQPANGRGGTGDIVAYAEAKGKRVLRIDPGLSA